MLRLSKMSDYGTVVLAHMARYPQQVHAAIDIADATHLTAPTVSKLLKLMARRGLVISFRGANGGYALARSPGEITAAEIIDAVEGPVAITQCSLIHSQCGIEESCSVGRNWQRISAAIRQALSGITLIDLIASRPLSPNMPNLKKVVSKSASFADVKRGHSYGSA